MKNLLLKFLLVFSFSIPAAALFISLSHSEPFKACNELGAQWRDVSGKWVASVGPVIFRTNGLHVTGIYNEDTWSLDLQYSRDRKYLSGTWSHRNGLVGPVIFHLNSAGCITHARWGGTGSNTCNKIDSSACVHDWAFHGRAID